MKSAYVLPLLAAALLFTGGQAAAQQPAGSISGTITGPDNAPIANQTVVLHRVQATTGATVAETMTAGDGSFTLSIPGIADTTALYFVATRYEGELYIGPPFRAGEQVSEAQVIQVGVPGTSATAMLEGGGTVLPQPVGRAATNRNWLLLAIPLVGVAAVAIYALIPRSHVPRDRALLIRIAELDERMSSAQHDQRAPLFEERSRLTSQLRAL
ncbi:MAG TPA: carboxypeptidase-like regulatory domain-containing protein [Longimicrobiales bacterium]|nr:carboxypeptidase-like regulatory domain-containing protein [Longimicrobiales bacterium]